MAWTMHILWSWSQIPVFNHRRHFYITKDSDAYIIDGIMNILCLALPSWLFTNLGDLVCRPTACSTPAARPFRGQYPPSSSKMRSDTGAPEQIVDGNVFSYSNSVILYRIGGSSVLITSLLKSCHSSLFS